MGETATRDAFLGGRVRLWQPRNGYRAGVDPVLLAASVEARAGQSVLDLGCGVGAAALCLAARVPGVEVTGLERQADYAALARRNAAENHAGFEVVEGDLSAMPAALKACQFDHVIANPPYYDRARGTAARDRGREAALGEATPLALWVEMAAKRLCPKGYATFIQRAERLPDLLSAFHTHLGSVELWPLTPRTGRASQLILIRGRKGGRADFRLHDGLVLHEGAAHDGDRESYTPPVRAALRDGAALRFPRDPDRHALTQT
ncbi:MAG: methyltransferase [Rhodobacterales bacterium]|nr:MAG: methyltransferase [Rhodobacterales bacterium]